MNFLRRAYRNLKKLAALEMNTPLIHPGEAKAQTLFGTHEQAKELAPQFIKTSIEPDYAEFIQRQDFFFIATSDSSGRCDCSFRSIDPDMKAKGIPAVCIQDERALLFPDLRGNGMYQSFGNILQNPHIGMIFINFETAQRVRVNGTVEIIDDAQTAREIFGPAALRMVRVQVEEIFANCPKRIPKLTKPDAPA